jgi:hypothetical protein
MTDTQRIDRLEALAVRVQIEDAARSLDVELVMAMRPDIFFEAGPAADGFPDKIGMHGVLGDLIPDDNEPWRFVPPLTSSWDAAKRLMLPNWCIDCFHEWFDQGCSVKLIEGERGATGRWYHTERQVKIEQQGSRNVGVLLAAILLSYAYTLRWGRPLFG